MVSADQETIYSDQNPFKIFSSSYSSLPANTELLQSAIRPAGAGDSPSPPPINLQTENPPVNVKTNLLKSAIRPIVSFTSAIPKLSQVKDSAKYSSLPKQKTSELPTLVGTNSTLPTQSVSYQNRQVRDIYVCTLPYIVFLKCKYCFIQLCNPQYGYAINCMVCLFF